jgi:hypothetical protein
MMATRAKNPPASTIKIVASTWSGFYKEDRMDPQLAEISGLKGDWDQRIHLLVSSNAILILSSRWPSGNEQAKQEAVALGEAIIWTSVPDPNAKAVDYFPGAGSEPNVPIPAGIEIAMPDGMILEATTPVGKMRVEAVPQSKRSYTWEGATRSVIMGARTGERWYGSKGLMYPGPGNHWEEHNGISRGVLEEGQQHFKSTAEAMAWLKERSWMPFVHNNSGLVVGWQKVLERQQLNVEVWQIMINGKKPKSLPGATDAKIEIIRKGK